MLVSKENIESLIPQRPPFVMIDELLQSDASVTRTKLQVREDNIFVEKGLFREPGMLENIAQTAAARAGNTAKHENVEVPMGYIGAVSNFEVYDLPVVNAEIETEINITNQIFNVSIIKGRITCNDKLIAQCEMKIFIANYKTVQS